MGKKTNKRTTRKAQQITEVIIHISDSTFGNAALIDSWHRARGWSGIGYHYVILNGKIKRGQYREPLDGMLETGRDILEIGAHCYRHNTASIGICLIGKPGTVTENQLMALAMLFKSIYKDFPGIKLKFHSDYDKNKPNCPGLNEKELISFYSRAASCF